MRSQQEHLFSHVPSTNIPRSTFNRTHGHKTTFNAGYLVPFYVDEALPGDTFNVKLAAFARLSTPIVPIMDNLFLEIFFFFVPNRLLWLNWQKFMGEQTNPGDSIDYLVPQITAPAGGWTVGSLGDYFGIPTLKDPCPVNALPFRAYNMIYNQWFRDENLTNSADKHENDGPDPAANFPLRRRGKRHDYFTSCLPWPQKGAGVTLPLGSTAPLTITGNGSPTFTSAAVTARALYADNPGTSTVPAVKLGNANIGTDINEIMSWGAPALTGTADLSTATAATINSLRQAFQIQKLLERDARGGTRYTEILRSHFGVISPDARLQRPEFLGGGTTMVNINPVAQTSSTGLTGGSSPQGHLAAFGTASTHGIGFSKSFVEHGVLIGLMSVRADLSYQQGLHRSWSRRTRYDFYWPAFANLGEQAVLGKEIYFNADGAAGDETVFGYQERWAEYRYFPSKITGKFRSTDATPLDIWHLAQKFTTRPLLNDTFIQDTPPIDRVVAVTTEPHFLFDSLISIQCARPMPVYSVPGLIDHF